MQSKLKIILIGLGKVGREVLQQLPISGLRCEITALADSTACLIGQPLSVQQVSAALETKSAGKKLIDLPDAQPLTNLVASYQSDVIIVDTSAAPNLDWGTAIRKNCKMVFANKNAHSAPWSQAAAFFNNDRIRYESTVGAGLPVIATLRSMLASGDQITRIEGVMSGTLGYLCSQLEAGATYSQAVQRAFEAGYTEPDPRDDLSGFDVLRKSLILGRTAGWRLEQTDFSVQALYDDRLIGMRVSEFFQRTALLNETYTQEVGKAAKEGRVLRYLATITPQGGHIGLQAVERSSALGALQGPGNYFAIHSRRYDPLPLVIAGPGAGIVVTANGVLNDIIALTSR